MNISVPYGRTRLEAQIPDQRVQGILCSHLESYVPPMGQRELVEAALRSPIGASTLEELVKLPGVGRKTANVIQSVVFNKAAMAVDTHVFRVSHRIGLVPKSCTTPLAVEKHLMKHIPEAIVPKAHHWLILHGRYVCIARKPKCEECGLNGVCAESFKAKPQ